MPRRFKITLPDGERWGCYFPNSNLSVNDQGIVSQGMPVCGNLESNECVTWIDQDLSESKE